MGTRKASGMDGPLGNRQRGLAQSLGQSWMSMASARDIFGTTAKLHHGHGLTDQVRGARPENVDPQKAVGAGVSEHFDNPLRLVHAFGPSVGGKVEPADVIWLAGL